MCRGNSLFARNKLVGSVHRSVAWTDHYCKSDLCRSYILEDLAQVEFYAVKTEYSHMWSAVYLSVWTRESTWNPNSNTLEPGGPQHVIAHQCSATSVSLHFHSRKQTFGASFKNVIISNFYYLKIAYTWNGISTCTNLPNSNIHILFICRYVYA